jgi:sodium/pantothenate symporter
MNSSPITITFLAVQALYLLCLAGLASVSYRRTGSVGDFFVMGRSAGAFLTGVAYFATQFSMSSLVGVPGEIYSIGFAGLGIILSIAMLSMAFGVFVAGGRLHALGSAFDLMTLPDYLATRYDSDLVRFLGAAAIIAFQVPYLAAQVIGAGVIFNVFTGAAYETGVLLMGGIVIAYCMAGGMRATILTDALQGVLMVVAAIAIFAVVSEKGGGLSHIMARLSDQNPGAMSFPGHPNAAFTWKQYVSQILMWTLFSIGQPQLVNKYLVARSYRSLINGSVLSGIAMTLTCATVWTTGVMAMVVAPGIQRPDWVMPTLLALVASPLIASLFQAGILSAGMSTVSSLLIVVGGAFSRDIYQKLIRPEASDRSILRLSRLMIVAVGAIVLLLGVLRPATIFRLVLFAWSGTGILAVPILAGLYWRRATKEGAAAGILAGLAALLLVSFLRPAWGLGFHPVVVSSAVAAAALVGTSLLSAKRSGSQLEKHFAVVRGQAKALPGRYLAGFSALYLVVWLPIPYVFPWREYLPGWFGVPVFIWVWLSVQAATAALLLSYKRSMAS